MVTCGGEQRKEKSSIFLFGLRCAMNPTCRPKLKAPFVPRLIHRRVTQEPILHVCSPRESPLGAFKPLSTSDRVGQLIEDLRPPPLSEVGKPCS